MRELMVPSADTVLSVKSYGHADQPVLLFLHGFPDNQHTWHYQVSALRKDFNVVTFDMRGVGESERSHQAKSYSIDALMHDIESVIDAVVGPAGRVHLVGHDWGSVMGWSFISDPHYGSRVLSFTSLSGPHLGLFFDWVKHSVFTLNTFRYVALVKQMLFSWYVLLMQMPLLPDWFFEVYGTPFWRFALSSNGVGKSDPYLRQSHRNIQANMSHALDLYRHNSIFSCDVPRQGSITTPVQLVLLKKDRYISEKLFERYDRYVTNLTTHTLEAKHWAHHSHSDEVNELIRKFVSRVNLGVENH